MNVRTADSHVFSAGLPLHHRHCPVHMAVTRHARPQSYRLLVQSAASPDGPEKKTTRTRRKPKDATSESSKSTTGRRRKKKVESEEEDAAAQSSAAAADPVANGSANSSAEAQPEAVTQEQPSAAEGPAAEGAEEGEEEGEGEGLTENEYWKLVLEQHSPEEIMEELEKMDGEGLLPEGTETLPMRVAARPGCTPFEFVKFTDETIEHEVALTVDAPIDKVYKIWSNRLNYNEWFDLIGQMVLHKDDPQFASYFMFYKWGALPTLELYATMQRNMEENKFVMEHSIDGMELCVAAFFSEAKEGGTDVNLRVSYLLPENLRSYVGPVGVWGDVNDILQENLLVMKVFVEQADLAELEKTREESQADMDMHLAETNAALETMRKELDQEGVEPDEGSPAARGEMASILKELGFDAEASLRGTPGDEQTWWERESAARREQASSSAAASAEAAAQQREDQQARQAEEDEGKQGQVHRNKIAAAERDASLASRLTKEFLEENMHKYTQKDLAKMFGVGTATISRYVVQYGLKWPVKKRQSLRKKAPEAEEE